MIYLTNGNMPLNAAYADEIVQEENSTYQLSFRFPTSDLLWEQLKEETFLTADDLHGEQDFVIFEVEKKHGYIQVYANQVFTLLNNYVVNPISLDRQTGSTALSRFAGSITRDNPFSFFSDIEDRHTFNIGSKNAMEAFAKDKHSIIGQWDGDLVRHGYQVRLLKNGGSENESLFMYQKNLSSYQHKTSTKSLKTRITFIATVKGEGEKAPDRTFTVTIDSPLINKYSQIYEDVIEVNDQDVKDEASLRKYGEQYYRTSLCDMMEDSLEIEVVGQSDVPVQMFDVVSIFHERYNLDVRKKITKYTYSPMAKKLKSIGFGQFQSGLANAIGNAVSDAVKGEAQQLHDDFERQLARELKNADLAFDRKTEELQNEFTDGLNAAKTRAEEVKRELSDIIDQRFSSFENGPLQDAKRKAIEALQNAGASSSLAQEAKRIGLESVAKLEEFKRQATSAQTALSGDLDVLKRTVNNEVNQASEHRRTTTEALSRITGQMNGFATKSEVAQGIDGLTQTFAKMRVGGRNLIRNYDWNGLLPLQKLGTDWKFERVEDQFAKSGYMLKATCTKAGNGGFYKTLFDLSPDEFQGKDMTSSWDMKASRSITFNVMGFEAGGLKRNVPVSTEWERISNTFKVALKQYYSCVFYANGWEVGDVVYIRDPQLEEGTIATTPRPAPEDGKDEILAARTEFKQTADGLSIKMATVENYVSQDGQRQETLRKYTRDETARQVNAVRELVTRDYVGKSTFQESVQGVERRFESLYLGSSGNLLKNSNDGFYNKHDKRYRLVETLQANQVYTLVSKYWHGENSTNHTFYDGVGKWQRLNYNKAIDAWMVQFTPTQEIPAGTEIILSAVPNEAKGNMSWATLVRGAIPLIHWQPAKGDVEEGVTQKLAEYKETIDGRFADITSLISGKANQTDFQRVKETSQLYERILGNTDNGIADNVARMAVTNQIFQVEVGKYGSDGINRALNTSKDWTNFITIASPAGINLNADLHKVVASGLVAGDKLHVCLEISIDDVQPIAGKTATAVLQSWGDVKKWNSGNPFDYRLGNLIAGNNWRKIEYDVTLTEQMLGNNFWWLNVRVDGASRYKVHTKLLKIEKGSRATPWSPAPEDTDEAIRTVQSQLAGSWGVHNKNSVNEIIAGFNLAGRNAGIKAETIRLEGNTLADKLTAIDGYFKRLFVGEGTFATLNTDILRANSITADKMVMDMAFFNKFVSNEAYLSQLFAKQAFITRVQSVTLDASQIKTGVLTGGRIQGGTITGSSISGGTITGGTITGSSISGGTITGSSISGATLTGHTKIKLGTYGSFDTVDGGLQINVPRTVNSKDGLGVQFIGSYGRGTNVPYGLYIYKDSDLTTNSTALQSDDFIMTVEGYIKAKGIGWFKTDTGSVNGKLTATIGLWNSNNVSLAFGGSGNDIYYSYNGTAYSLWSVVNQHFSDRRLKDNIVACEHKALDYIHQFQFKEYDWKKQEDRPQQAHTKIGLIAQDVQAVDPTLVYENGDTLNLDNLRLTNIALKAIQELALENRKLTHRLENLENERRTA